MRLGVAHHAIDLVLVEAARCDNGDLLLATSSLVAGGDVDDTVSIDVEGDFDLRNTARGRRNAIQDEAAQRTVILSKLALALQDVDLYARLAIASSREDLALLRRNGRVALDQARGDPTQRLDTERERRDVEQQYVFDITSQNTGLNGGADRYD